MNEPPRAPPLATEPAARRDSLFARERQALFAHRATLRGNALPTPKSAPRGTFLHGFFLPFSLIAALLRDRALRGPYLRLVLVRALIVFSVAVIAIARGSVSARTDDGRKHTGELSVIVHDDKRGATASKPVHVDVPGLHVDLGGADDKTEVSVLGQALPVTHVDGDSAVAAPPPPPPTRGARAWDALQRSWGWLLALLAFVSATEAVVVFFSRRWDDWLSFHASSLARIRPEDEAPKEPKVALDLAWLYRKMKRRMRGYVVFGAGLPALLPLRLVPTAGPWLFTLAATLWGWYWLGVFSAAKSAHAWADEATAPSPRPIRELRDRLSPPAFHAVESSRPIAGCSRGRAPRTRWSVLVAPLRLYAWVWAWLTSGMNPAAATFERSPASFLGLALARALLSLPGLYLLARPIVPVAAGRLCAEADPADRFSAAPPEVPSQRVPCAAPVPSV